MKKTPFYKRHVALGAKMVEFHGWLMPLYYTGIVNEHMAVRNSAGLFDVSHMGRIEIKGPDAYNFVQFLITNNLEKAEPNRAVYTPMCNLNGGIIDDLIVYTENREYIMLVVNAGNVDKDFQWIKEHVGSYRIEVNDISPFAALLAVQGQDSPLLIEKFLGKEMAALKHFYFMRNGEILVSRTGYTGEDGFELFIESKKGLWLWDELMKLKIQPIGLGARDTLRLESGYILYGNDADEKTTPIEAGISWTVDFSKLYFIGKDALQNKSPKRRLMFIELEGREIPREGHKIMDVQGKDVIGEVTSGTYSPSLQKGIALGYIDIAHKGDITIDVRGHLNKGRIYEHPRKSKVHKDA